MIIHLDDTYAADSALKSLSESEFEPGKRLQVKPLKATTESQDETKIECSWYPASAAAVLRLESKEIATSIVEELAKTGAEASEKRIRNRKPRAILQADRVGRNGTQLPASVMLVNLDPETTAAEIQAQFQGCTAVLLREPKYKMTEEETLVYIRDRFEINTGSTSSSANADSAGGAVNSMRIISSLNESRRRAVLTYSNAIQASRIYAKVKGQNNDLFTKMDFVFSLSYSVGFNIPRDTWKALRDVIRELSKREKGKETEKDKGKGKEVAAEVGASGSKAKPGKGRLWGAGGGDDQDSLVKVRIIERGGNAPVSVHFHGNGRTAVADLKAAMQTLLKGKVICDEGVEDDKNGKPLWDPVIFSPQGKKLVQAVMESGVHVKTDYRNRTVTLYGSPEKIAGAEDFIKKQYTLLRRMQHEFSLKGQLGKSAFKGGIAAVKEFLGEDMIVVDHVNHKALVRCSPADVSHVRSLLYKLRGGSTIGPRVRRPSSVSGSIGTEGTDPGLEEDSCPVCMESAEPPVIKVSCGHTYCKSCLQGFIKATLDSRRFPITCFHTAEVDTSSSLSEPACCSTPFAISTIQDCLSKSDADQLFEAAFASYIQCRPKEYSYCPTPDCPTVYKVTATNENALFTCSQCLLGFCTSCKAAAHHGQTCAEYKAATCGEEEYQAWKSQAGVKTCPKCFVDIEKVSGCNHITCKCSAHICWHCMKDFDVDKIYEHLSNDCGGVHDEPVNPPQPPPPPPPPLRIPTPPVLEPELFAAEDGNEAEDWIRQQEAEYHRLEQETAQRRAREGAERQTQEREQAARVIDDENGEKRLFQEQAKAHAMRIEELWRKYQVKAESTGPGEQPEEPVRKKETADLCVVM